MHTSTHTFKQHELNMKKIVDARNPHHTFCASSPFRLINNAIVQSCKQYKEISNKLGQQSYLNLLNKKAESENKASVTIA